MIPAHGEADHKDPLRDAYWGEKYRLGSRPVTRLNMAVKAHAVSYPSSSAISESGLSFAIMESAAKVRI
jgi:hypothetical protein